MAVTDVNDGYWLSLSPHGLSNQIGQAATTLTINGTNDLTGCCFVPKVATAIDKVVLYFQGSPTADIEVTLNALQTSTPLKPDLGTEHASETFTPSSGQNTVTFTSPYTPTAGTPICCVCQISGSGSSIHRFATLMGGYRYPIGLRSTNTGSSWLVAGYAGMFGFEDSSGNLLAGTRIINSTSTSVSGTSTHITAQKIRIDSSETGAKTIRAFSFPLKGATATYTQTWKFGIWNSSGTLLATAVQSAFPMYAFHGTNGHRILAEFTSDYELSTDTDYYLGVQATASNSSVSVAAIEYDSNADLAEECPGIMTNSSSIHVSKYNGTSWTDSTDERIPMDLYIVDEAGGGGGGGSTIAVPQSLHNITSGVTA